MNFMHGVAKQCTVSFKYWWSCKFSEKKKFHPTISYRLRLWCAICLNFTWFTLAKYFKVLIVLMHYWNYPGIFYSCILMRMILAAIHNRKKICIKWAVYLLAYEDHKFCPAAHRSKHIWIQVFYFQFALGTLSFPQIFYDSDISLHRNLNTLW